MEQVIDLTTTEVIDLTESDNENTGTLSLEEEREWLRISQEERDARQARAVEEYVGENLRCKCERQAAAHQILAWFFAEENANLFMHNRARERALVKRIQRLVKIVNWRRNLVRHLRGQVGYLAEAVDQAAQHFNDATGYTQVDDLNLVEWEEEAIHVLDNVEMGGPVMVAQDDVDDEEPGLIEEEEWFNEPEQF